VRAADRVRAGTSLGALVAANAPALTMLNVSSCALGDEGLGPLVDALAANTHLQTLNCSGNGMSKAFAFDRLLPAVRANTSLRSLTLHDDDVESPGMRVIERMVAERT
jgi:Ran GTPase-activating protein (RanGAP) involved in mRNA processing and transport